MRRMIPGMLAALCLAFWLMVPAWAEEERVDQTLLNELDTQAMEELAPEEMDGVELSTSIDLKDGLQQIIAKAIEKLGDIVKNTLRVGVLLMVSVLLCGLLDSVQLELPNQGFSISQLAGTIAILALALTDVTSISQLGQETMEQMDQFSKAMLPNLAMATAASGQVTAASVRQMTTMFFSDVLLTLIHRLLLPMVYLYTALSAGYAVVGNSGLKNIAGLLKWGVTTCLTGLVFLYVTYLSVSSAVAGTADATASKAASLAISAMVPVVGGILSSATETVVIGAGLVKNAIGIFGLLGVLAFCIGPFLQMGIHYLVYKVTSALSATLSTGRVAGLIGDIGSAFGLILGMTGANGLILMVSIVSGIGVMSG